MITVYVKHYLNQEGRDYFDEVWYPHVLKLIQCQDGFIKIDSFKEPSEVECVNIIVVFENEAKLSKWVQNAAHQAVIDDLDIYRTKGQCWYVCEQGTAPADLTMWEEEQLHAR